MLSFVDVVATDFPFTSAALVARCVGPVALSKQLNRLNPVLESPCSLWDSSFCLSCESSIVPSLEVRYLIGAAVLELRSLFGLKDVTNGVTMCPFKGSKIFRSTVDKSNFRKNNRGSTRLHPITANNLRLVFSVPLNLNLPHRFLVPTRAGSVTL